MEQGEKVPRDIRALLRLLPHPYEVGTLGFGARNPPLFFFSKSRDWPCVCAWCWCVILDIGRLVRSRSVLGHLFLYLISK